MLTLWRVGEVYFEKKNSTENIFSQTICKVIVVVGGILVNWSAQDMGIKRINGIRLAISLNWRIMVCSHLPAQCVADTAFNCNVLCGHGTQYVNTFIDIIRTNFVVSGSQRAGRCEQTLKI